MYEASLAVAESLAKRAVSENGIEPPLSQAVGYVIVLVVGLIIAFGRASTIKMETRLTPPGMVFLTKLLKRTVGEDNRKTEVSTSLEHRMFVRQIN